MGRKSSRVFVSGGEDRKVNLWSIGKLNPLLSLSGHSSSVESVALDSAEVLVLGGSSTGIIKLWDLEEAKIVRTLTGHRASCTAVGFHPFGEFFASGSLDTDLKIWDIRKKGCIHTYKGHTGAIQTIKFTPDGRWVVTGGMDNVVKLWDLTAGKLLHEFKFHNGQIRCIDFHPHEFLLATGSADRTVKFWDLETFELIGSAGPEATGVRSMIFHPDGKTLFCALDSTLKVFSWEPIRCHDILDMGWSTLADLSVYEGKLLGCSFHESRVGIWVADISLIDPYALGVSPKSNGLSDAIQIHEEDISLELKESYRKSSPIQNAESDDYGTKVKEGTRDIYMIPNGCTESVTDEIDSSFPSKLSRVASTGAKKSMAVNSLSVPSKINSRLSSRVKLDSTIVNDAKTTQRPRTPQNKAEQFVLSRSSSVSSSTAKSNNNLNSRKIRTKEMLDPTDIQTSVSVSIPIVIPRGTSHLATADTSRITTPSAEASFSSMDCKSSHVSKPSFLAAFNKPSRLIVSLDAEKDDGKDIESCGNISEKFERSLSLQSQDDNDNRSTCSSSESSSIKYVKGVAIRSGRTRSLVERFEKREPCDMETQEADQSIESNLRTVDDVKVEENMVKPTDEYLTPEALMENRDVFTNVLKSRLTKLQVVRHFWEQNGIIGAINAVAKLPDHAVLADVFSILHDKIDQFTLDMFLRLLPLLAGLLNSKTERHITASLGILVDLVKIFKPVITSTLSASSIVGVDLHQEQRIQRCTECSKYLENIKELLPPLIRRGGLLAKPAGELHILLRVHD